MTIFICIGITIVTLCCILSTGYYIFSGLIAGKSRKVDFKGSKDNKRFANTGKGKSTLICKTQSTEYAIVFLQPGSKNKKSTVYINKEIIGQLKRIVVTIGNDKATLGGYVESIILSHFKEYKDEIIRLFNKNIEQPFQ